jgi:SAM-dependent methyltransferase
MLSEIKRIVKSRLPRPALEAWWKVRRALTQLRFRNLDRRAAFQRIYRENLWGGQSGEFCSGLGSASSHAESYAALISDFIRAHGVRSIVDLGCGDFTVAQKFLAPGLRYVGVDIVPELIAHHQRVHARDGVSFECLDLVDDPLPAGELCLVRQVLQHLSNADVARFLSKTGAFRYVIVTEHVPAAARLRAKNLDKPHGPDIRLGDGSGLFLEAPPFSVPGVSVLREIPADPNDPAAGLLRTVVFSPSAA